MSQSKNIRNIQVGDSIVLTFNSGNQKTLLVTRVEDKSWYYGTTRNSYGTLERLINLKGDVVNCVILKKN